LTTAATTAGAYDAVVIDPSGLEGRKSAGHAFLSIPQIDSVFPNSGSDLGGTEVTVLGHNFVDPMTVRIDGVGQSQVVLESDSVLRVTTDAGVAGGPYVLELETPSSQIADAAFTYSTALDPSIALLTPDNGSTDGGRVVTLSGANFTAN